MSGRGRGGSFGRTPGSSSSGDSSLLDRPTNRRDGRPLQRRTFTRRRPFRRYVRRQDDRTSYATELDSEEAYLYADEPDVKSSHEWLESQGYFLEKEGEETIESSIYVPQADNSTGS